MQVQPMHRSLPHPGGDVRRCNARGCNCSAFFFIVAEGAWVLRCRCKHKHTEHDPAGRHACTKAACGCQAFDSPWVCNCNCPWANHTQRVVEKQVRD
jgi:Protein FAM221A/B